MFTNKEVKRFLMALPLVILFVVVCVVAQNYVHSSVEEEKQFGYDLIKLAIQFLLLTVAGGFLLQASNRRQERSRARREFRREILRTMNEAYYETKKIRRLLRAKCEGLVSDDREKENRCIAFSDYEELMGALIDAHLKLEMLEREIHVYQEKIFNQTPAKEIQENLHKMSTYLGEIVNEYRNDAYKNMNKKDKTVALAKLPLISIFTRTSKEGGNFREGFRTSYYTALESLRSEDIGF